MVRRKWNYQSFEKKEEALRQKHWKERDALRKAMARHEFANYFDYSKLTFEGYCIETQMSVVKMLPVEKGIFNSEPLLMALIERTSRCRKERRVGS